MAQKIALRQGWPAAIRFDHASSAQPFRIGDVRDAQRSGPKMSSEQDQVVATAPLAESRLAVEGTSRRRIVVAQKPVEKPIALISRDSELSEEFEKQLGRARTVVVFPSLTHLCTDSSRMVWGGVVIARSCGWDARLLGFVPSTSSIAFWRVAEEGYGWPSSVSRLDTQEDIVQWLEEIAKPLPFPPPKAAKRAAPSDKRAPTRGGKPKAELKFELATVRSVVQATPLQMELNGLAEKRSEPAAVGAGEDQQAARSLSSPLGRPRERFDSRLARPKAAPKAAALVQASLDIAVPRQRRGRPPAPAKAQDEALTRDSRALAAKLIGTGRGSSACDESGFMKLAAKLIGTGRGSSVCDESGFMKLAAELGLARAGALLDELRAHAQTLVR